MMVIWVRSRYSQSRYSHLNNSAFWTILTATSKDTAKVVANMVASVE